MKYFKHKGFLLEIATGYPAEVYDSMDKNAILIDLISEHTQVDDLTSEETVDRIKSCYGNTLELSYNWEFSKVYIKDICFTDDTMMNLIFEEIEAEEKCIVEPLKKVA